MEIIKKGNTGGDEYLLLCYRCGCSARFNNADIHRDRDGEYVICPQCKRFISTDSNYITNLL